MNKKNAKKNKRFSLTAFMGKATFLFLTVSILVSLVSNEIDIAAKKQELEELEAQVIAQQADNQELALLIASGESEMVERVAREEYDYADPIERVFVDISGK